MNPDMTVGTIRPPRWWVLVLLGVISFAAGIVAITYADITLRVLGIFLGVYLLIAGAVWVAMAVETKMDPWEHVLGVIVGFLSVLAGLICVVRPGASILAVLLAVAFWFLMVGIADLARAFADEGSRWANAIFGLLGIVIGVLLISDPDIGVNTVALIAGIGFMLRGVFEVAAGLYVRTA